MDKEDFKILMNDIVSEEISKEHPVFEIEADNLVDDLYSDQDITGRNSLQPGDRAAPSLEETLLYIKIAAALYNFIKGIINDIKSTDEQKKKRLSKELKKKKVQKSIANNIVDKYFHRIVK